jgi:hypothetical protein
MPAIDKDKSLRDHLRALLSSDQAHINFDGFVNQFPIELIHKRVGNLPYTAWQVLEHMRIAQFDILEFSRNAAYVSPPFPEGYWPPPDKVPAEDMWRESVRAFQSDLNEMDQLVAAPATDLFAPIPHGTGQTILREVLLLADHNAYHVGVLMGILKALG